jgi:hypothetical protein
MEPLFILTFHVDKAFRVVNLQAPLDKLARTDIIYIFRKLKWQRI